MPEPLKIHIVEDESLIAETIKTVLHNENYVITGISNSGKNAIFDIEELQPDIVLVSML